MSLWLFYLNKYWVSISISVNSIRGHREGCEIKHEKHECQIRVQRKRILKYHDEFRTSRIRISEFQIVRIRSGVSFSLGRRIRGIRQPGLKLAREVASKRTLTPERNKLHLPVSFNSLPWPSPTSCTKQPIPRPVFSETTHTPKSLTPLESIRESKGKFRPRLRDKLSLRSDIQGVWDPRHKWISSASFARCDKRRHMLREARAYAPGKEVGGGGVKYWRPRRMDERENWMTRRKFPALLFTRLCFSCFASSLFFSLFWRPGKRN